VTVRRGRLSRIQVATLPRLKEIDFQRQLVGPKGLATMLGWLHVHFRPAQTQHGWRTPGSGELAQGWPDLTLVRTRDHRLIFAELKRDGGKPTAAQWAVLDVLAELVRPPVAGLTRIEVYVWHPSEIDTIAEILR
jgi:hypothetical protein